MKLKLFFSILLLSLVFSAKVGAFYNEETLQNNWLYWTNTERQKMGAKNLIINENLNATAQSWSEYSKSKGSIDHKRLGQKSYYDFNKITKWFSSKGVSFKKVKATTFSESIGWNTYSCNQEDCTEQISSSVYKTFAMYMREKGKKYSPHYKAMINPIFGQVGVGIILDDKKHKYYITVHYGTEVVVR